MPKAARRQIGGIAVARVWCGWHAIRDGAILVKIFGRRRTDGLGQALNRASRSQNVVRSLDGGASWTKLGSYKTVGFRYDKKLLARRLIGWLLLPLLLLGALGAWLVFDPGF